jgi:hypothetical protein
MILRIKSINSLVFVMETQCIFFEADSGFLNSIWMDFKPQRLNPETESRRSSHDQHLRPLNSAALYFCGPCAVLPLDPLRLNQVLAADMSAHKERPSV